MGTSNRLGAALAVLAALAAAMALALLLANVAPVGDPRLDYWIAVLWGNWSSRKFGSSVEFAEVWQHWLGVMLALSFNVGSLLLLLKLVANFSVAKRRYVMKLIQALDVLRADIEGAIYKGLSDKEFEALEPKIRSAIEDGYRTWRERSLVTLLGKHGAKKLLEDLESAKLEEVN